MDRNHDLEAIRRTALDFVEGWHEGDADRMKRSLHPSLVKRAIKTDVPNGVPYLNYLTREEMVAGTKDGGGTHVPADERIYDIEILDVYKEIASVKAVNPDWIDYLHVVKIQGVWVIANVLYTANRKIKK